MTLTQHKILSWALGIVSVALLAALLVTIGISNAIEFIPLPLLLGLLLSVVLCAIRVGQNRPPSFAFALMAAAVTAAALVILTFGRSLLTSSFWEEGKAGPGAFQISIVFGAGFIPSLAASFIVVALYRSRRTD